MSDDLDIVRGGSVAVDTTSLRRCAAQLDGVERDIAEAADSARWAQSLLAVATAESTWRVAELVRAIEMIGGSARALADRLRSAAVAYEYVELAAERVAAHADRRAEIDRRLAALLADDPGAVLAAAFDRAAHPVAIPSGIFDQAVLFGAGLGPAMALAGAINTTTFALLVAAVGRGRIPGDERLVGPASAVTVTPVTRTIGSAPTSLSDVLARVPDGSAQVRVERYSAPEGKRIFAVYVAGSRSRALGGREPFDLRSNLALYRGERSASYDVAVEALAQAGARPGDEVHLVGYSQGAMIAGHLALEGGYDTKSLITIGSPIEVDPGEDVLVVALRHTDDPIAALSAGGRDAGVGSADSFVAERSADPLPGPHDVDLPAHHLSAYRTTAAMVDASDDPRADALQGVFDELGDATLEETIEYTGARARPVMTPSSAAGG